MNADHTLRGSPRDLLDKVANLASRLPQLQGAVVSYAQDSAGRLLTLRYQFTEDELRTREEIDYLDLRLVREVIDLESACGLLREIDRLSERFGLEIANPLMETTARREYRNFDRSSAWPEWTLTTRLKETRDNDLLRQPLVRRGLPPYSSLAEGVNSWVWPEFRPHLDRLVRGNEAVFVVPDLRGHISQARWVEDKVPWLAGLYSPTSVLSLLSLV